MGKTKEEKKKYYRQYYFRNDGKNRRREGTFSRKKNLLGKKYGRLLVVAKADSVKYNSGHHAQWECVCECGKIKIVRTSALMSGDTVSCGCYKRDRVMKPNGVASFNLFIYNYKRSAKNRNIDFLLSNEEIKEIISQNCNYCGAEPKEYNRSAQKKNKTNGNILANGIDRIDNSKGYTKDNCVPCCSYCNSIKNDKTKKEFLDHIEKIYKFSKGNII